MVDIAAPRIDVVEPAGAVQAVALVLHGGREHSTEAVRPGQLAVRRMRPFARRLAAAGGHAGLAVWSLQHGVRGWNGEQRSPVTDAEVALERIRERHGDVPVVLVGHSMGGRTAVAVAGNANVVALAALAPWLPAGEPYAQVAGRAVLVAHGSHDRITSPDGSLAWARLAATVSDRVWWAAIRWERHGMVLRAPTWHALATEFSLWALAAAPLPPALARAGDAGRLRVAL